MATETLSMPSPHHKDPMSSISASLPGSRTASPIIADAHRISTPPLPASKPIPLDFRSSLSAWWSNSSYREARISEERLLRRMAAFQPNNNQQPIKGWFGWSSSGTGHHAGLRSGHNDKLPSATSNPDQAETVATTAAPTATAEATVDTVQVGDTGLIAKLRDVFIPTPDPSEAPQHPADPILDVTESTPSSSTASLSSGNKSCHKHHKGHHHHHKKNDKLQDYINTLEITSPENANSKEAVVMLHGYAAAMGFFFRNWDAVAQSANKTGRRTFFLDWLGMGLSSRPSPNLLASPTNATIPQRVARAEHFFLSSLESWRISEGLDKMVLVGHSLGGYLASAYAVRYPERVSGLVLVSPAGIPRGEFYKYYKTSGERNAGDLDEAVEAAEMELGENGRPEAKGEAKQWENNREQSFTRKQMMRFFMWSWERGVSPFTFLRNMGPWAPMFAARYTNRRFAKQSEEDRKDLHQYIYNTSILKGSGEYCISHILAPGAYARIPIVDRIHQVKVPVTFLYGDNDWMDVDGGKASVEALNKAGNHNAAVHVVQDAGHHVYLDNPEDTNELIDKALRELPKLN